MLNVLVTGMFPDGQQWTLQPLLFGNWQLSIGPADSGRYDRSWHYDSYDAVTAAIICWIVDYDDTVEPAGWFRALDDTGRRRHDGDPEQEYIHW
jgi:hypothetical protein